MRAIVVGWFSYAEGHATAGDVLARDLLCDWLESAGIAFEIAAAPPFVGTGSLDQIDPSRFTHAFFVCGPFTKGRLEGDFFRRFQHCRLIGLNLSLDLPLAEWNLFDFVIARDSLEEVNPDMLFASTQALPRVCGFCLVEEHPEADVGTANAAIAGLISRHPGAWIEIDTRLDTNSTGLRSEGEIEAVIRRMDILVTTRLHGLVLALKNHVPVLVIDAVPGGGKIRRQCARIGWTNVLGLEDLDPQTLDRALNFALSEEARELARGCARQAHAAVGGLRARLLEALADHGQVERSFATRQLPAGAQAFSKGLPATDLPAVAAPWWPGALLDKTRRLLARTRR